ncbi:hypothetical protein ACFLVG_01390 [Chloroflexota bacterium]
MGKNPDPSWEELELIFRGFSENQDGQTILEEIQENMSIPRNKRFIRQRKLHYDVAKKVLHTAIEREVDPIIVEQRKRHYTQIADIAKKLLENEVDTIEPASHELIKSDYQIMGEDATLFEIDKVGIISELERNLFNLCTEHSGWDFENLFLPHFAEDYPELKEKAWEQVIKDNPYDIVASLRVAIRRATFKGVCSICKDW